MDKPKKKRKPKKGKVVRITPDIVNLILIERKEKETISGVIRRLLNLSGEDRYVLPSDLYARIEEARGVAIVRAVKSKNKKTEKPIKIKVKSV